MSKGLVEKHMSSLVLSALQRLQFSLFTLQRQSSCREEPLQRVAPEILKERQENVTKNSRCFNFMTFNLMYF